MSSDESSELSSVPSDTENDIQFTKKDGLLKFFPKVLPASISTEDEDDPLSLLEKREPSPAHEYILADNPNIAFIVMFRSRFTEAFPKSLINFGPQELEQDIVEPVPGERVENFLCVLLGLLLNRKQDVKAGHYNRALEEAIQSHKSQWPKDWENKTPLSKGTTFSSMLPEQRLTLLRTLTLWALSSSDVIKSIIQSSYKQQRQEDDLNQPLSVQPWGSDSDKRRYYLIEGLHDTQFRVYRESNHLGLKRTWWSVASNIEELRALGEKLQTQDRGQKARVLSGKILAAIPRFEAAEEKRKRREYRATRKQMFKRADPDYSIYEGRTRGKRIKYTFSDEDEDISTDISSSRRSTRNNGTNNSSESNIPIITQSGRQIRSRQGGSFFESIPNNTRSSNISTHDNFDDPDLDNNCSHLRQFATHDESRYFSGKESDTYVKKFQKFTELYGENNDHNGNNCIDEGETSTESEFDEPEDCSVDNDNDEIDNDARKLIVKLPVRTPTPDHKISVHKSNIKPRLAPEEEGPSFNNDFDLKHNGKVNNVPDHNSSKVIDREAKSTNFIKTNSISESYSTENSNVKPNLPLKC